MFRLIRTSLLLQLGLDSGFILKPSGPSSGGNTPRHHSTRPVAKLGLCRRSKTLNSLHMRAINRRFYARCWRAGGRCLVFWRLDAVRRRSHVVSGKTRIGSQRSPGLRSRKRFVASGKREFKCRNDTGYS